MSQPLNGVCLQTILHREKEPCVKWACINTRNTCDTGKEKQNEIVEAALVACLWL